MDTPTQPTIARIRQLWPNLNSEQRAEIKRLAKYMPEPVDLWRLGFWTPHAGAQERYFNCEATEALFGGAAGPGKTDCIIIDALKYIHYSRYNAVLFRRTFADLTKADGLEERTRKYYPKLGGEYNSMAKRWRFPSGAHIYLGGMEREPDKYKWQGAQFQYIGFDELTHFTESQYLYLFSRLRRPVATYPVPLRVRAGSNPGGIGHEWVKDRFVLTDCVRQPRWFTTIDGNDTEVEPNDARAVSRQFVPARHTDNPSLDRQYIQQLMQLLPHEQAQLIEGDWNAGSDIGLVYPMWNNERHITAEAEYNPNLPVYWALDDGYNPNPRAAILGQILPGDVYSVFAEYYETQQTHQQTAQELLSWPYPRPDAGYFDPSANMLAGTFAGEFGLDMISGYNNVQEGLKAVARAIYDNRLIVHPRCKMLLWEIGRYRQHPTQKLPNGDPRPIKENDHLMDALRYWIATSHYWGVD